MEKKLTMNKRTACLIALQQRGNADISIRQDIGGIVTLSGDLADSVIVEIHDSGVMIGFPPAMTDAILATWIGWNIQDDMLTLIGAVPGMEHTFQMRTPISNEALTYLQTYDDRIFVGVFKINPDFKSHTYVDGHIYVKLDVNFRTYH